MKRIAVKRTVVNQMAVKGQWSNRKCYEITGEVHAEAPSKQLDEEVWSLGEDTMSAL